MKEIPLSKVYRLVEPGPVVLVTTAYKGQANVMTLSYHMMLCHQPPVIAFDIGPWIHSFKGLRATKECVIAIPTVDLASTTVEIGNCSCEGIDKFKTFGLTAVPAKKATSPLIAECLANNFGYPQPSKNRHATNAQKRHDTDSSSRRPATCTRDGGGSL